MAHWISNNLYLIVFTANKKTYQLNDYYKHFNCKIKHSIHRQMKITKFRWSLDKLVERITETYPCYIRCIKPNDKKEKWFFDKTRVIDQLVTCGVLETIKISSVGYPSRLSYSDFFTRYENLLKPDIHKNDNIVTSCISILDSFLESSQYKCGKTKIFMKVGSVARLEERLRDYTEAAAHMVSLVFLKSQKNVQFSQYVANNIMSSHLTQKCKLRIVMSLGHSKQIQRCFNTIISLYELHFLNEICHLKVIIMQQFCAQIVLPRTIQLMKKMCICTFLMTGNTSMLNQLTYNQSYAVNRRVEDLVNDISNENLAINDDNYNIETNADRKLELINASHKALELSYKDLSNAFTKTIAGRLSNSLISRFSERGMIFVRQQDLNNFINTIGRNFVIINNLEELCPQTPPVIGAYLLTMYCRFLIFREKHDECSKALTMYNKVLVDTIELRGKELYVAIYTMSIALHLRQLLRKYKITDIRLDRRLIQLIHQTHNGIKIQLVNIATTLLGPLILNNIQLIPHKIEEGLDRFNNYLKIIKRHLTSYRLPLHAVEFYMTLTIISFEVFLYEHTQSFCTNSDQDSIFYTISRFTKLTKQWSNSMKETNSEIWSYGEPIVNAYRFLIYCNLHAKSISEDNLCTDISERKEFLDSMHQHSVNHTKELFEHQLFGPDISDWKCELIPLNKIYLSPNLGLSYLDPSTNNKYTRRPRADRNPLIHIEAARHISMLRLALRRFHCSLSIKHNTEYLLRDMNQVILKASLFSSGLLTGALIARYYYRRHINSVAYYEHDDILSQYILLHYGKDNEQLIWKNGAIANSTSFPKRCIDFLIKHAKPKNTENALDAGCAVGRSAFELSKYFRNVDAFDYSRRFIDFCNKIKSNHKVDYSITNEANIFDKYTAFVPENCDVDKVQFFTGNACENITSQKGSRSLNEPIKFLSQLPKIVADEGLVMITSPYTWLERFTKKKYWLGGKLSANGNVQITTRDTIVNLMQSMNFCLIAEDDIPMVIRETSRKHQWTVPHALIFRKQATSLMKE
ncbi:hypothetical protein GJ496_006211 [Pomphorhynchus laevis]|nr:hypothetical protein GJ496_006211 [Pomphorhynchus laevis]